VETLQWPKGTTPVQIRFLRFSTANNQVRSQVFSQQTFIPTANRTVSAFFTYGTVANVQAPATGAGASFPAGAALLVAGATLLLLGTRGRRHAPCRHGALGNRLAQVRGRRKQR
jgi:hypothetical protein